MLACYWLLTAAWLYRSAVNEGMNKSLWMILALVCNLLAVAAFLDRAGRAPADETGGMMTMGFMTPFHGFCIRSTSSCLSTNAHTDPSPIFFMSFPLSLPILRLYMPAPAEN